MAVSLVATIQRWQGLSSDIKPTTNVPIGSVFHETDTGRDFVWSTSGWLLDEAAPLSLGQAVDLNLSLRLIAEQTLLEVQAANRYNGIEPR